LLTSDKFEDILPSNPHLLDIQCPYPGVYTGMFIHADGTAPSIRSCQHDSSSSRRCSKANG
jgi:hypothetical protein